MRFLGFSLFPVVLRSVREDMTPRNRKQSYYGYAFESYCTSATPDPRQDPEKRPNGWSGNVNTNVQWCSVVKTKLGDNRLIIGGEVDCVNGSSSPFHVYKSKSMNITSGRKVHRTTKHIRRTQNFVEYKKLPRRVKIRKVSIRTVLNYNI